MSGTEEHNVGLANPVLAAALSVVLPGEKETQQLRACLGLSGTPGVDSHELGRLAPMLIRDRPDTFVRIAYLREQLRTRDVLRICEQVLEALDAARTVCLVLKGVALAATVYPEPALRHAHDLELLVRLEDRATGDAVLQRAGFQRRGEEWVHPSGFPIRLHTRLFNEPYYVSDWIALERRAQEAIIGSRRARVLSAADSLVHVCGHAASTPHRHPLQWVCDAWTLIASETLDWDHFVSAVAGSRLELPICVALGYLADQLDAMVPPSVRRRLADAAQRSSPLARDVALYHARLAGDRSIFEKAAGISAKAQLLRWLMLPSSAYMQHAFGVRPGPRLPVVYLSRYMSYVRRRISRATTS